MLVLLFVALWYILRGDLFKVLLCIILFLCFCSPFSIAITSLGEERANLSAFRRFVRFALVWFCLFPLPLGDWEGLRLVIVALPGLVSYRFWHFIRLVSLFCEKKISNLGARADNPQGTKCMNQLAECFSLECTITKTCLFKYTENFSTQKWKFSDKKFWYFSYFCSKHRLWVLVRTASTMRF